tara:strand:- start:1240 stop:1578 length:339 start_codon:yes stop_codon:yes gene_type:complete
MSETATPITYKDTKNIDFIGRHVIFQGNGKSLFETRFGMQDGEPYEVIDVYQRPDGFDYDGNSCLERAISSVPVTEFLVRVGDKQVRLSSECFLNSEHDEAEWVNAFNSRYI